MLKKQTVCISQRTLRSLLPELLATGHRSTRHSHGTLLVWNVFLSSTQVRRRRTAERVVRWRQIKDPRCFKVVTSAMKQKNWLHILARGFQQYESICIKLCYTGKLRVCTALQNIFILLKCTEGKPCISYTIRLRVNSTFRTWHNLNYTV